MDKTQMMEYLQGRRDTYISLAKHAIDRNNSGLCFTYMEVAEEIDKIIFVFNLEFGEEK